MIKSSYRVVADLFKADGTLVTHVVRDGVNSYAEVEKTIASIYSDPPAEYSNYSKVSPRWEMGLAL